MGNIYQKIVLAYARIRLFLYDCSSSLAHTDSVSRSPVCMFFVIVSIANSIAIRFDLKSFASFYRECNVMDLKILIVSIRTHFSPAETFHSI